MESMLTTEKTMASKGLACHICYECFDDQNHCPRMLHCGHTFCSGCLEQTRDDNAITCPTCRQICTVSMPAGVEDLPKNFQLLYIIDTINATTRRAENEASPVCEEIVALATKTMSVTENIIAAEERALNRIFDMYNAREDATAWIQDFFKFELHAALKTREQLLMNELNQFFINAPNGFAGLPGTFAFLSDKNATVQKCLLQAKAVSNARQEQMKAVARNASTEEKKAAQALVMVATSNLQKACEEVAYETQGLFMELHDKLDARKQALIDELNKLYDSKHSILLEQLQHLTLLKARLKSIQSSSHTELPDVTTLEEAESQCIVLERPQVEYLPDVTFDEWTIWNLNNLDGYELNFAIISMGAISDKSTCARITTAAGFGLQCAPLGSQASFTITADHAHGCRCGLESDVIVVELKENTGERKVEVNLEDKGDGTYLATYTVPADAERGDYMLSVLLRGAHIKDSPFVVRVGHPY